MDIQLLNIEELTADFDRLLSTVTPQRQEKVLRYRQHDDRLRSLGAGLLLQRFLGIVSDDNLTYGPYGKPLLAEDFTPPSGTGRHFSLSHAGKYVLLATHNVPVGADIEEITSACNEAYLRDWTAKEAIMKCSGLGFRLGPEKIKFPTDEYRLTHYTLNNYIYCLAALRSGTALRTDNQSLY